MLGDGLTGDAVNTITTIIPAVFLRGATALALVCAGVYALSRGFRMFHTGVDEYGRDEFARFGSMEVNRRAAGLFAMLSAGIWGWLAVLCLPGPGVDELAEAMGQVEATVASSAELAVVSTELAREATVLRELVARLADEARSGSGTDHVPRAPQTLAASVAVAPLAQPAGEAKPATPTVKTLRHIVRKGETVESIATLYAADAAAILAANPGVEEEKALKVDSTLIVPYE